MRKARLSALKAEGMEETSINLTPLIDVVFVVLIIFILIAPMLEIDRVQLATAAQRENKDMTAVQENSPIAIHVRADNTIWVDGRIVSETDLFKILKDKKRAHPKTIPQLFHDKKAQFGTYQTVKNAIEMAGFEQLDVILQPG